MLKESLQIKNVGALKDTGVVEIKSFTVFIGNSASGKSTMMKVLDLMRYIFKRISIRAYLRNSSVDDKLFYIRFNDLLRDDLKNLVIDESYIRYVVNINGHEYSVVYDGKLMYDENILNNDIVFSKNVWVSEMRSVLPALASKGTFAKNVSLGFYFDETRDGFDEATDVIKHFDLKYVGLKMDITTGGNNQKKYVLTPDDNTYEPIDLKNASSGVQTTAPLLAMVKYFATQFSFKKAQERSIIKYLFDKDLTSKYRPEMEMSDMLKFVNFYIEEPELSLDPSSQLGLINELVRLSFYGAEADRTISVTLATHSPYILNNINLLVKAYDCGKDIDGAKLSYDNLSIFMMQDGGLVDLKIRNMHYVNTDRLSRDINDIYDQYQSLIDESHDEESAGK